MSFLRSLVTRATKPAFAFALAAPRQTCAIQSAQRFSFVMTQRRSMATITKRTVPTVFGPTGKLATELFEESKAAGNLSAVRDELNLFLEAYNDDTDLRMIFMNPLLTAEKRETALAEYFDELEMESQEVFDFVLDVNSEKLLDKLRLIIDDFEELVQYELKEVHAEITSAEPLTPAQLARIESALKSKIEQGDNLLIETSVDPTILGGLIVVLKDQILDLSVASQIEELDQAIRA